MVLTSDILEVEPVIVNGQIGHHDALGVPIDATAREILTAYKRQSIRWHPDKNIDNRFVAERRFKELLDAKNALVDDEGELRPRDKGIFVNNEEYPPEVGMHKTVTVIPVEVSLEELFRGCVKSKEIKRERMIQGDMVSQRKLVRMTIKAGWRPGTQLYYANEGDQVPGGQIADLVFELKQLPHLTYRRVGDDIEHRCYLDGNESDLRLEMLTSGQLGKPSLPVTSYCNITSELCSSTVTLLDPHPVPEEYLNNILGNTQSTVKAHSWKQPKGKGIKLRDKGMTMSRVKLPGAGQSCVGNQVFSEPNAVHSICWKISKKTDEIYVGLAPDSSHCDRKYYSDVAKGKWGFVWGSDGGLYNIGNKNCKVRTQPYGPGDICQISFHADDDQLMLFKNKQLVFRSGEKIVVPRRGRKRGEVATVYEQGMPVLNGDETVGRGDLQVYFLDPVKPKTVASMPTSESEEKGSSDRLLEWLACRGHPDPEFKLSNWDDKYQIKLTLAQSRPFSTNGKFDGTPFLGKPLGSEEEARDSASVKALRMLYKLSERFPDQHIIKFPDRIRKKKANSEEGDHSDGIKRSKLEGEVNEDKAESPTPHVTVDLDEID
eukprot:TRINITY_DN16712_c0_g1_i1.p1 TRINITY_DN16712_c0_g1~~TRINITY_DN16712_c0_g1_i1.p1  ORF type:complete len:621 (+),score=127.00 TRINITY_DN16712_c0_g1_i1:60-1865(+)